MARLYLIKPGGYQDLVAICVIGVLTVLLAIYFPGSLPVVFLAFFCIFFAPGWALVSFIFPGPRPSAGGEEYSEMTLPLRVAASVALSVLLFAIGGLLLAWSPLKLTEVTVLAETLLLTLGLSALAMWKRASLAPGEVLSLSMEMPKRGARLNRAESVIFVIAVAGLLFASAVALDNILKGSQEEPFTEMFITGPDGKVNSLPLRLPAGTNGIVQVHVNNNMGSTVDYVLTVGIPIDGGFANVTASDWSAQHALVPGDGYRYVFTVGEGQGIVGDFIFNIGSAGPHQVLFLLDFEGDTLDTWLWVTVI
jgi:uncharacterized membrane protein